VRARPHAAPSDEIRARQHPVVVLSDGLWRATSPPIRTSSQDADDQRLPLTVVGVADPRFTARRPSTMSSCTFRDDGAGARLHVREPSTSARHLRRSQRHVLRAEGFLRPGITFATAATQADALWTAQRRRGRSRVVRTVRVVCRSEVAGSAPLQLVPTLTMLSAMACWSC